MALRYRNYSLRSALALGTSLTALFLLVRCSVPGRDYDALNIGENAGSAGDDSVLHGSAGEGGEGGAGGQAGLGNLGGQGGEDDVGGQGGQGGTPLPPVPCVIIEPDAGSEDAGVTDAGITDAGITDAGSEADASVPENPYGVDCECVDGFIRAIDADGDGDRSRACTLAPGLDCDDGDNSVTHNSCGGCTALPNTVGDDCLDCGAYVCSGPESVVCATKPGYVAEDPDCRCLSGEIIARDTDSDGEGTRLCEQNPGTDCNDGDSEYVSNACGGCEAAPGNLGDPCNVCGVYSCNGTAFVCTPAPTAAPRCQGEQIRETCVGTGFWEQQTCDNVCYQGNCEVCTPGTIRCGAFYTTGDARDICAYSTTFSAIMWVSYTSCITSPNLRCDPVTGGCTTGHLLLPRDNTFDVVPRQRGSLPWYDLLNTASESDYG